MAIGAWAPPAVPHLRLSVRLRSRLSCRLPGFHGSMLRGALGMALRRAVCTQGMEQLCRRCPERQGCAYARLFETAVEGPPPPLMGGSVHAPRPVVVEPKSRRQRFAASDPLDFDLLLLGQAARYHPFVALALERMGRTGLGAQRAPFALDAVRYREHGGRWLPPPSPAAGTASAPSTLRLSFLTPTRLLVHKQLDHAPTFRTLALKAARRVLEVAHFHVPGARPDWELDPLLELAETVRADASALRWIEIERYSNRQRRKLSAGGLVGHLDLHGDLAPFIPLLRAVESLHFGKGATYGLGRVAIVGG